MAEFTWEARGRTGEVRRGVMEADNEEAVNQRLRSQQLAPVRVSKRHGQGGVVLQRIGDSGPISDLLEYGKAPVEECPGRGGVALLLQDPGEGAEGVGYPEALTDGPYIMGHENVGVIAKIGSIAARSWGLK